MNVEFSNCILCGKDNTEEVISLPPFCYVRCRNCDLVYLNPRPSQGLLNKIYQGDKFHSIDFHKDPTGEEKLYFFRFSDRLKVINRLKKRKGKILDIGSSWGYFLSLAKEDGWDVYGVEPTIAEAKYAQERFKVKIFTGRLREAQFPAQYFDVVSLWHVLEHIPDPIIELLEIKRILKEDGLLVIEVPSTRRLKDDISGKKFDINNPPQHLFYYNISTLSSLLEKIGFHIIKAKGIGNTKILKMAEAHKAGFLKIFVIKHFRYLRHVKKILQSFKAILRMQENIIIYAKLKVQ